MLAEDVARTAARAAIDALNGVEGFALAAAIDSPIRGGDGNLELLVHMRR